MQRTTVDELKSYPNMVRWFNPVLLSKLVGNVIVSGIFGQYADRRLIHAALDPASPEHLLERADLTKELPKDKDGAIWIDYVADLGDGFDATYAIASLLAAPTLKVDDQELPRGGALVMGGDEVYPLATQDDYLRRMRRPYRFAFPNTEEEGAPHPLVFMIPGNHDWYDGLTLFLALFCRKKETKLGSWRTRQRRSYFALQLVDDWWLWAIDIQLSEDMDQPQHEYFETIADKMPTDAKIILCTAEPGWYKAESGGPSYETMEFAAQIAQKADRNLKVVALLSGDHHHYARYSSTDLGTQFITSGGGGAFLHPTHQLKDTIDAEWLGVPGKLLLKTEPSENHEPSDTEACYPKRDQSRALLKGDLWFPITNPEFCLLVGIFYALFALIIEPWSVTGTLLVSLGFTAVLAVYTGHQEGWNRKHLYIPDALLVSIPHGLAHGLAVTLLTSGLFWAANILGLKEGSLWFEVVLFAGMLVFGGAVGGFIFGLYLLLTCRYAHMNDNDAFSAMRLDGYRHFLRLRILGDTLTVYAVGLDRVPKREDWRDNPASDTNPTAPWFVPESPLEPHLIEKPIVIRARKVAPIADAAAS